MKIQKQMSNFTLKLILGFIILGIVSLFFIQSISKKPEKTAAPTVSPTITSRQEIKNEIAYELPVGWSENIRMKKMLVDSLAFSTHDYADYNEEGGIGVKEGAVIDISKRIIDGRTLREYIGGFRGPGAPMPNQLEFTKINGHEVTNFTTCWDVCEQDYYIVNKNDTYLFRYRCGTSSSCETGEAMEQTKYYQDFLSIIQSVKFMK